ncbi:unnamed protein product [Porites evermanni]|uniref:Uncharacterized protein n=1 Tax=Porites evermanni TaxID=104178 RepID=A0ABN8SY26_9CNID|nr:unnamed protein product [Porites evermanni]
MILNGLKLNEEKAELLLLSSRYRPTPTSCALARISYFNLMVIEDFLLQDLNYGTAYPHL